MNSRKAKGVAMIKGAEKFPLREEELWPSKLELNFSMDEPELPTGYRHLYEPIDVLVQYL